MDAAILTPAEGLKSGIRGGQSAIIFSNKDQHQSVLAWCQLLISLISDPSRNVLLGDQSVRKSGQSMPPAFGLAIYDRPAPAAAKFDSEPDYSFHEQVTSSSDVRCGPSTYRRQLRQRRELLQSRSTTAAQPASRILGKTKIAVVHEWAASGEWQEDSICRGRLDACSSISGP